MKLLDRLRSARKPSSPKRKNAAPVRARVVPAGPTAAPLPLPRALERKLHAFRATFQQVEIATGVAVIVAAVSLLLLAQAFVDWWFDLPRLARLLLLVADLVVLGALYRRFLHRPIRTRPPVTKAALAIEKKWPQLRQSVITAVELAAGGARSTRGSLQLVEAMLARAQANCAALNFNEVLPLRLFYRCLLGAGAALLVTLAVAAAAWPATVPLIERIVLLDVPLPTRTIVVSVTRDLTVPAGSDVVLTARAQGVIPSAGRVTITNADGAQDFPVPATADKPDVFAFTIHNVQSDFRYAFHLNDGHGPEFAVEVRVPPAIARLECEQDYPPYTGLPARKLPPTDLSLLAGSRLKISAVSTRPLKSATVILAGITQTIDATLDSAGTQATAVIPIPAKDLTGFSVHLVDTAGVQSVNDTVYSVVLVPDKPPELKILEPADSHESITLHAKPALVFEAHDDYGLAQLTLHYKTSQPPVAGQPAPPATVKDVPIDLKSGANGRYMLTLDPAAQTPPWTEGTTISYWLEAVDNNNVTGPGRTKTDPQQLEIVSAAVKQAELLERLKQNADEIDSLSDTQQKASTSLGEAIKK